MVKEAYSFQVKGKISAEVAHSKSLKGELTDQRAFECIDKQCKIQLTCTKWGEKDKKRIYFTPSSRENLHIAGCKASGEKEEVNLSTFEKNEAKKTVTKNGILLLKKILDQNNQKDSSIKIDEINDVPNNTSKSTQSANSKEISTERSTITSIMTLINLLNDPTFDKNKPFMQLPEKEMISINELFVNIDEISLIPQNRLRIFYGKVKVSTYNTTALKINFIYCNAAPLLFTNKKLILNRHYGKQAKKCVDKNEEIYVFFRGYLTNENKWKAYNDEFYKDLYFSLDKNI
ncbi:hypothetical protein [Lysinibacillus sp. NPDC047702]|uniref:hypothetical protein n=1 Tax=unclassified Lysinibacillus TaxID=2636778 RepID=UPI003D090ABE